MTRSPWRLEIIIGGASGIVIASIMTAVDWSLNPGGVFYNAEGTDWGIVWETWISWFMPVFPVTGAIVFVAGTYWRKRR